MKTLKIGLLGTAADRPGHVPPELAAVAEPLAVCLHAARRAGPLLGKRVLVTGCGPIGALSVMAARAAGAAEIVAVDIADAPLVEIAGRRVMDRVGAPPVVVGREGQDADHPPRPVVDAAPGKQGSMAAIMLQHEQTHQEAGGGNRQGKAPIMAVDDRHRGERPESGEGHHRHDDFEHAAPVVRLAIGGENAGPGLGVGVSGSPGVSGRGQVRASNFGASEAAPSMREATVNGGWKRKALGRQAERSHLSGGRRLAPIDFK